MKIMPDIPYQVIHPYYDTRLHVYRNDRPLPRPLLPATSGGQGSFSYLDTKVYGPRQQRQMYQAYYDWYKGIHESYIGKPIVVNPLTGYLEYDDGGDIQLPYRQFLGPAGLIIPGTGGSAKAPGKRYFGSRAIGFKPEGLVLIRLIKI